MWLLSQYSSQHCGVYTYILALDEYSSSSINANRHRPLCQYSCPQLLLFLVHNYIPLAHNLNKLRQIVEYVTFMTSASLTFPSLRTRISGSLNLPMTRNAV
jgi:hypothetical protein